MGLAAGTEKLRRHQSADADRMVTGQWERAFEEPFADADWQGIDDDSRVASMRT